MTLHGRTILIVIIAAIVLCLFAAEILLPAWNNAMPGWMGMVMTSETWTTCWNFYRHWSEIHQEKRERTFRSALFSVVASTSISDQSSWR